LATAEVQLSGYFSQLVRVHFSEGIVSRKRGPKDRSSGSGLIAKDASIDLQVSNKKNLELRETEIVVIMEMIQRRHHFLPRFGKLGLQDV